MELRASGEDYLEAVLILGQRMKQVRAIDVSQFPAHWQKAAVSRQTEVIPMKQHRFWAWAAVFCMVMVMLTGYKHK